MLRIWAGDGYGSGDGGGGGGDDDGDGCGIRMFPPRGHVIITRFESALNPRTHASTNLTETRHLISPSLNT